MEENSSDPSPPTETSSPADDGTVGENGSIVAFVYAENGRILRRRERAIEQLNEKSANLIRLLGVIFTLYSGAVLVAARLGARPDTELDIGAFVNEYVLLSIVLLAAAFLYAVLAYHWTNIARGPGAEYLKERQAEDASVEDVRRDINQKVPGWVQQNDSEIEADHTRLFNCKMCIFFSLGYLVFGAAFGTTSRDPSLWIRAGVLLAVGFVSYLVYDRVRHFASTGESDR